MFCLKNIQFFEQETPIGFVCNTLFNCSIFLLKKALQRFGLPTCYSDLSSCDCYLFTKLKNHLNEYRFDSVNMTFMLGVADRLYK